MLPSSEVWNFTGSTADDTLSSLSIPLAQRFQRLKRDQDREDFLAARALTRYLLTRKSRSPSGTPSIVQNCPACGHGDHGKPICPEQPETNLSWSHSHGQVAAIVAPFPVGIDLECHTNRHRTPPLSGDDDDVWAAWVKMEAAVKLGALSLDTALSCPEIFLKAAQESRARLKTPQGPDVVVHLRRQPDLHAVVGIAHPWRKNIL